MMKTTNKTRTMVPVARDLVDRLDAPTAQLVRETAAAAAMMSDASRDALWELLAKEFCMACGARTRGRRCRSWHILGRVQRFLRDLEAERAGEDL